MVYQTGYADEAAEKEREDTTHVTMIFNAMFSLPSSM